MSAEPTTRQAGLRAEDQAARLLERSGYVIVARNVRVPRGELDVVAWDGDTLCVVEVRSTRSLDHGGPLATVGRSKQQRIIRATREYLVREQGAGRLPTEVAVRFDVLGLWQEGDEVKHTLVRAAFVAER